MVDTAWFSLGIELTRTRGANCITQLVNHIAHRETTAIHRIMPYENCRTSGLGTLLPIAKVNAICGKNSHGICHNVQPTELRPQNN